MKNDITTIKLLKDTKERLDKLRLHKRETYDEILQRTLGILNLTRMNPEKAQARLKIIEKRSRVVGKKPDGQKKNE